MATYKNTQTPDLRKGDVVYHYGARWLIVEDAIDCSNGEPETVPGAGAVHGCHGEVIEIVHPGTFTMASKPWWFQGNRLAVWAVEEREGA